eukprot:CAMPEP_0177792642 /NCGR_PEP_ID=MMETSP0491_2-20121128/24637_1 /TAXON_ID=63592 /ORGANISM="Tetraselmis chuii, Strain PLY429" /LENGTH=560 /DNA_ID=CAMNT_0019315077 /DNA_START=19 /DNA_END=1698 /DNA_ORIENTATION=+
MAFDCGYLKETVGEALARGCAATVTAEPNDPVEYLGRWLLRYVQNAEIEGKFYMERDLQAEAEKKAQEEVKTEAQKSADYEAEKKAALMALAEATDDPYVLFQQAVELVQRYTDAAAAYVATIEQPEEGAGELAEEEVESEDEERQAAGEAAAEAVEANIVKFDYANCLLRYVAATENDSEVVLQRVGMLTRPVPLTEEEAEDEENPKKETPLPPTFNMLDEQVPTFFIPNVAENKAVNFFRRFPRMGSYFASAVQGHEDEYRALLCADTVVPQGSGKVFSQADKDFIWDVSRSLTKAVKAKEGRRREGFVSAGFSAVFDDICKQVTNTLYPPPPEPEEGAPTPEPAPTEEAEVEEEPPAEEEDDIARCQREIRNIEKHIEAADKRVQDAVAVVDVRQVVRKLWAMQIENVADVACEEVKQMTHAPPATLHVLKAVVYIMKEDINGWATWPAARAQMTVEFLQRVLAIDAEAERDMEAWNAARRELKACDDTKLPEECPASNLGSLLRKYLRAVRATSNKAVIQREKEAEKAALEGEKAAKEEELAAAETAKAEAEAAAA